VLLAGGDGDSHRPDLPRGVRVRSAVAVPLLSRGRLIGVMTLIDGKGRGGFTPAGARIMGLLLEPVAVALDSALLLRRSEELSITDDLTRLYNSRFLNAALRREVERSRRYRVPVSLIFLDLDGFKSINDRHGHLFGSRALVEVGAVVRDTVRTIDVVARFGGDEFTIILPQTGRDGARVIAERIRERIAATAYLKAHGLEVRVTASLGIATYPENGVTGEELVAGADKAMYAAKDAGKDRVMVAEARPQARRAS
jgi:diguanylate cyclase (GGDEF)-like protein